MIIHGFIIPALLTFVPWLLVRYVFATTATRNLAYLKSAPYLWAAMIAWEIGILLPIVPITNETETFGLHFMGGVVACILFYFVKNAYQVRFSLWWQMPLALYFFVSGLGVANELFELFLNQTSILIVPVHVNDTWWDLLANTAGATVAFGFASLYRHLKK